MDYISTRSHAGSSLERVPFERALLAGLAPDGGLYVPTAWPKLSCEAIAGFAGKPFSEVACEVLSHFVGSCFSHEELHEICLTAFARFTHPATTPLRQTGPHSFILELFHGPTLAFKDVAMLVLGEMFERVLARKGERLTIMTATSGDTGGAAVEAFQGRDRISLVVLHPNGRISEVQRRFMTTCSAENIHNIAVDGTFDDCQSIVKALFQDRPFAQDVNLSGVNSINWARIAIQTVYYFTVAVTLGAPDRKVSFVVPTGNFGDIYAGYVAGQMGLPIGRLCVATNQNDIVHRATQQGTYAPKSVVATSSPSMDIQVASNFERLIYDASGRDADLVGSLMNNLKQSGQYKLPTSVHDTIKATFTSGAANEDECRAMMARHYHENGCLIDPHTAVGEVVRETQQQLDLLHGPVVTLATAHPAKFPEAVFEATGLRPELPRSRSDLLSHPEHFTHAVAEGEAIKSYIKTHCEC